jgi:hypothetical protein
MNPVGQTDEPIDLRGMVEKSLHEWCRQVYPFEQFERDLYNALMEAASNRDQQK